MTSDQRPGWCIVKDGRVLAGPFFEEADPQGPGQCNRNLNLVSGEMKWGYVKDGKCIPTRRLHSS